MDNPGVGDNGKPLLPLGGTSGWEHARRASWYDLMLALASEARGAEKRPAPLPIIRASHGPDRPEATGRRAQEMELAGSAPLMQGRMTTGMCLRPQAPAQPENHGF